MPGPHDSNLVGSRISWCPDAVDRRISILFGNREQDLNDLFAESIRAAFPQTEFSFAVSTTAADFIKLALETRPDVAIFIPPGNIDPDPAGPGATPEGQAIHIVRTIKSQPHQIPIICMAVELNARESVLAAGADFFFDAPIEPSHITTAIASCLKL